jgi:hypothetical protein
MPLFSRPDGTLLANEPPVRQIMPYMMPTRTESIVFHEARYDLSRTLPWLERYNASHERHATLFHLLLFAFARTLHQRIGLNRFVSGGHIYQRRGVQLSFAAKKQFRDDAPFVTVKLDFPPDETFEQCVERVLGGVSSARGGKKTSVDTELKLALMLPGFLLRGVMGFLRWLDRVNLLPGSMIASDPMYTSMFVANLGSIGIERAYHHLFEYGTCSLFGAVGKVEKIVFVHDGQPVVRDGVSVCWTFDERINDGFYCASSLKIAQEIVEDPERHANAPLVIAATAAAAK